MEKLCIYTKEIQRITDKSERSSLNLLKKIKKKYNKEGHQFITIHEFCEYTGLKEADVKKFLG